MRELLEYLKQGPILDVIWSQLADLRQYLDSLAPYAPDMIHTEFFEDRKEDALEDLGGDDLRDIDDPANSLFSNFISRVVLE